MLCKSKRTDNYKLINISIVCKTNKNANTIKYNLSLNYNVGVHCLIER